MNQPHPQPHPGLPAEMDEPDDRQRPWCARRSGCLDIAAEQHWRSFTCSACHAFALPDPEQVKADCAALCALGTAISLKLRRAKERERDALPKAENPATRVLTPRNLKAGGE